YGNDIITIIPATAPKEKIVDALKVSDSAVLMKVYKNFADVVDMLDAESMIDNAVLISRYGLDDEKIIDDIRAHRADKLNYLSTILTRRGKVEN
ncbi:MAG: precorrin-2 C(20)-methyltransferase, partial [Selenomonadaceae bacterium]|nr:precorrin-2 C(20)-methyltransferase [Selenomonadaceae bacterium]